MEKVIEQIEHLFDWADNYLWENNQETMLTLYWEIGYLLREVKREEISDVGYILGKQFGVEKEMFEVSYYFYKDNPIKRKALGLAK